ncbi:multicopper oxidase family protein [Methylorubrum sp. SB2]|uniref:multicopper oxidase family protein n=1 Tax=Methylorubrum subtropicum TaxID=3138812 RepID=UPI00313CAF5D
MTSLSGLAARLGPAAAGMLLVSVGAAQAADRPFANPTEMTVVRNAPEARRLSAPGLTPMSAQPGLRAAEPVGTPVPGEAAIDLGIRMVDGTIANPTTNTRDAVQLRAYVDLKRPPAEDKDQAVYAGPTIRVLPGDTVRITLRNELPLENCVAPEGTHNIPNCFNVTNLHSHGLWVSPTGNSDNVLLEIQPGNVFQYEYNIPADHPAGTFWYHPHRHGSTALQVASGIAGALIVRGTRKPGQNGEVGDIDVLLPNGQDEREKAYEKVLVMTQVQYACRDANGNIEVDSASQAWLCQAGETGTVSRYDQFGPGSWNTSGRYTSINGLVQPTLSMEPGKVERWRLVHAGVRDTISFELRRAKGRVTLPEYGISVRQSEAWVKENCETTPIETFEIAADGLTHARALPKTTDVLQPGYRSDLLVSVPTGGDYCVIDNRLNNANSDVGGPNKTIRLLALVRAGAAEGGSAPGGPSAPPAASDPASVIRDYLVARAEAVLSAPVAARVVADLKDGLKLAAFVPHKPIAADEVRGRQDVIFSIDLSAGAPRFGINHKAYAPERVDRLLALGGVEEWHLTSTIAGHPFHIHVNPFEIIAIYNTVGGKRVDLTDPAIPYAERLKMENGDPQFLDLKGVWKDTIFTKQGYEVVIRTRYQRYIGEFVLHCHILDHEDQGMMQNVKIVLPNTHGLPAGPGGHAH